LQIIEIITTLETYINSYKVYLCYCLLLDQATGSTSQQASILGACAKPG